MSNALPEPLDLSITGYAFFNAAPTEVIQSAIPRTERFIAEYNAPLCSISGGSDSDIMLDMVWRLDPEKKVRYVFFNTGLEMDATKKHVQKLSETYGIDILEAKPRLPVGAAVKRAGYPFWTKQVSEYINRLQLHDFDWSDDSFENLYARYPRCKVALRWWCNEWGENSRLNIAASKYLKEFMLANPPTFPISQKCCTNAKKQPAADAFKQLGADISFIGVRKFEGGARSTIYSSCFVDNTHSGPQHFPLFWFTDDDKRAYESAFGVTHSDAYTVYGCTRTGCAGCPFGSKFQDELDMLHKFEPQLAKGVENIFGPAYEYTRRYREFRARMKAQEKGGRFMSSEIISVLNALCEKLGIAVDWTAENIMPYAEQLIRQYARYLLVNAIFGVISSITVTVVCGIILWKSISAYVNRKTWTCRVHSDGWVEASTLYILAVIAAGAICFICILSLLFEIPNLVKAITIPEIYAAQELIGMISNL